MDGSAPARILLVDDDAALGRYILSSEPAPAVKAGAMKVGP